MKSKLRGRFFTALLLFSFVGQVAWVVENMYLNVFIYKMFAASAADIALMVAASAVAATLTTVCIGALSDRIGKRKLFICGGYLMWGISILAFSLVRLDVIDALFPMAASAASIGVTLVILLDCLMTFFGSSANDAAFNAWLTDATEAHSRGAAEGINAMMPLIAILVVFGGFLSFDLSLAASWTTIFLIIGAIVILIGVLGLFLIEDTPQKPAEESYLGTVLYGFTPRAVRESRALYLCLALFVIFNISIQIFMPYLIIYYEVSLAMTDYVFVMAPAILLASAVTALWGRVYDKKGFRFSALISLTWLLAGYLFLFFCRATVPVFIGSLLMMSGYLSGMTVFGARIRDNTPEGKSGRLQGVRICAQVLLPGLIGPFIGKTVLADAKTTVGSDGLVTFIPSADIFLAAAVPAVLLLLFVFCFIKNPLPRTAELDTPYTVDEIPHNYHPRPMMKRDNFTVLNGKWQFAVRQREQCVWDGTICVPFPPESALSGVKRVTTRDDVLVYRRLFTAHREKARLLLHFGAVDNEAEVFVNERLVGRHIGGYLSFTFDITDVVCEGENTLEVRVRDARDTTYPYGKQTHRRGGMWYTPVSGIWQTVWLEYVPQDYVRALSVRTTMTTVTITAEGGAPEKVVTLDGRTYSFVGDTITIDVPEAVQWSPETPHLYTFTLTAGADILDGYFALREIGTTIRNGQTVLTLNGAPYFFHGLLDQGYFPDGLFVPASAEGYADDIRRMKALGFNMLRKHIKLEPAIFYHLCDREGMVVFQDMVNNGTYNFFYDTVLPTIGLKKLPKWQKKAVRDIFFETAEATIRQLGNHPSVLYYTIFNEGWGQHDGTAAYTRLKPLDSTRIFDTASGWFGGIVSDVQSEHVYFKRANFHFDTTRPVVLSEFGGYSCNIPAHVFNLDKVYGYRICKTTQDLTADLRHLYLQEIVPLAARGLSASVYTQVSDVEDETNGLLTYDRRVLKPDSETMQEIAASLAAAFAEFTKE